MSNKKVTNTPEAGLVQTVDMQDMNLGHAFKPASKASFSTWIRVLSRNWAQGTVACKGRSDVNRTNRKPWKQKGTGRARAGSARSPLWKGGGVIFGPQERVCTLKTTKKLKRKVLVTILMDRIKHKNVLYADWVLPNDKPKTSAAHELLKKTGLAHKKVILFVEPRDFAVAASFINIPNVHPLSFDQVNAYDLANSECWLFLKKDFDHFKTMVSQWL